jgi:hypothetical protein
LGKEVGYRVKEDKGWRGRGQGVKGKRGGESVIR